MAYEVLVPPLGQTTDTVILANWYRRVGESVTQGEPLFAIETDKATLDIEAQASGVLANVSAQAGDIVTVLSAIGTILFDGEQLAPATNHSEKAVRSVEQARPESADESDAVFSSTSVLHLPGQRIFISPRAKRLAMTSGLAWENLAGTGPEGAIVERDVRKALAASQERLSIPGASLQHPVEVPAPVQERQPVATASVSAGQLATEVDVSALATLCARLNKRGLTVTIADLVAYMVIKADDRLDGLTSASMGILVAGGGYFTVKLIIAPRTKSLVALSRELAIVATDSTDIPPAASKLVFADLGRYGLDTVNGFGSMPDSTTLAIGRMRNHRDGSQTMWLTLSYSRTVLSEWQAVQYFNRVVQLIEDPDLLF